MPKRRKFSRPVLAAAILAGLVMGLTLGLFFAVGQDLPQVQALEDWEPGAATRIMSADGRVLAELFLEKRLPLQLSEIPDRLKQAVISVEDRRFRQHPGLDVIRTFGALLNDIRARRLAEGGSTITQQLARNLFLTPEKTLRRKLKELFLALQIERQYTKDEILGFYLNQVYFGAGAYGVGAAADIYFNKKVSELTLDECALLAGLPQSPEGYSPFRRPRQALTRRRVVLAAMVREEHLDQDRAARAAEAPLRLAPRRARRAEAPYFIQYIKNMLTDLYGEHALYKGGLTVETTLDYRMQIAAEKALAEGLTRIGSQLPAFDDKEPDDLQGAVLALEVGSGAIRVWVGGGGYENERQDHVADIRRQPGTAAQPLIYAAAIERGMTQADRVWDAPVSYSIQGSDKPWRPRNYSRRFEGEITLRRSLEISGNIPAIKLLSRIGVDPFITLARRLGLTSPLTRDLTLAMGRSKVSLLELVSAYQALAGRGLWLQPYAITTVRDRDQRIIYRASPTRRAALSPETAYIVTDMLKGVVQDGTAQRAEALKRPVAGIPGTTEDHRDALFLGYSPHLVSGVWVGYDSNRPLGRSGTGAKMALPIWIAFMDQALEGRPAADFERPVGVILAPMDRVSGGPAQSGDMGFVQAAFKTGTEPRERPAQP